MTLRFSKNTRNSVSKDVQWSDNLRPSHTVTHTGDLHPSAAVDDNLIRPSGQFSIHFRFRSKGDASFEQWNSSDVVKVQQKRPP